MLKKFTSGVVSAAILAASLGTFGASVSNVAAADTPNYAEALQKSLYFYECQQAGELPDWNRVEWRADALVDDEIPGGWYDAGDHVKFNLPMAYSASMLAWGLYQYPDGVEACGEMTNYVNNLTYALDYLAACDLGDEVVYQVGNGTTDHTWWGPVEVYQYGMEDSGTSLEEARQIYKASEGCSAVFGEMAAALAAGYCALEGRVDQAILDDYLAHAENIFSLADASQSDDTYNNSNASNFYRSSHFHDELFYAANWLYIATGNQDYLDKAEDYIPSLGKELGSDELKYSWGQCWDDVMQGGMVLYAINTNDSFYIGRVQKHVEYWTNSVKELDGGMRWLTTWGSLRHATAAAFTAAVACDTVLTDTKTAANVEFYEAQANYALGVNPDNRSFVVGYGENAPLNAHHRTAHGSWKNDLAIPDNNRHILYGALVGGPNEDGSYEDDRQNFINNEVATDYNAGFTALLCKMIDEYGGETDPSFPETEQHDSPEFYVEAKMGQTSASGATVSFKFTNHSAWPARVQDNLSCRYYMDLTELIDAGLSPSDVVVRCDRDQAAMYASRGVAPAEISQPIQYSGNIYYVEITLPDGRAVLPVSEGMQQCEILVAFVYPNYGSGWNADNDFSNTGLTDEGTMTEYIPTYINGELYYGREPDGTYADGGMTIQATEPKPTETTTTTTTTTLDPSVTTILYGDANDNGDVEVADAVFILQGIADPSNDEFALTDNGKKQSNCNDPEGSGIDAQDALAIQQFMAEMIPSLPV